MPTDFRDGTAFPRRGREALGDFLWLPRVVDKARAKANSTHDGYIYPCPMDRAMMRFWGVSSHEFTAAIGSHSTDTKSLNGYPSVSLRTAFEPQTFGCCAKRMP